MDQLRRWRTVSNIPKLYAVYFLTGLVFWYPIEKLFMQHIGIDPAGVGLNAVVLFSVILALDVPTGILADRWQRKYTLLLGMGCLIASSLVLGASNGLALYIAGTVLYGGYLVCSSGTFQAMMYDSLHELGLQDKYARYQGRGYALFLAGVGIGSLAGGYIAELISFRSAFFLSALTALLAAAILTWTKEPAMFKQRHDPKLRAHLSTAARSLRSSRLVFYLALFLVLAGVLRDTQNEFGGLYFIALGMSAVPMGYANAAKWLSTSLGQVLADRIGKRALEAMPLFFVLFSAFTITEAGWSLLFFYLAVFVHAILRVQAETEIQHSVSKEVRATALSMLSFSASAILIPLSLLFGWLAKNYGTFTAYRFIALGGLAYMVLNLFLPGRGIFGPFLFRQSRAVPQFAEIRSKTN